jgi:hypothetical protein
MHNIHASGRKEVEETSGWGNLHNEALYHLQFSSDVRVIKLQRIRWAGKVERVAQKRKTCRVGVGKPHVGCSITCGKFLGQLRNYKLRKTRLRVS